jgi:hypothetical protein
MKMVSTVYALLRWNVGAFLRQLGNRPILMRDANDYCV